MGRTMQEIMRGTPPAGESDAGRSVAVPAISLLFNDIFVLVGKVLGALFLWGLMIGVVWGVVWLVWR